MSLLRSVSITAAMLVASGYLTPAYAGLITILDSKYEIFAGSTCGDEGIHESSSTPVSAVFNVPFTYVEVSANGGAGAVDGGVGASVYSLVCGAGSATASLEFSVTAHSFMELETWGRAIGIGLSEIKLTELTNQLVLAQLYYFHTEDGPRNDSFLFPLDPSKQYRLETHAGVPASDAASAGASFRVTVPDTGTSLSLLVLSLGCLAAARRTFASRAHGWPVVVQRVKTP